MEHEMKAEQAARALIKWCPTCRDAVGALASVEVLQAIAGSKVLYVAADSAGVEPVDVLRALAWRASFGTMRECRELARTAYEAAKAE